MRAAAGAAALALENDRLEVELRARLAGAAGLTRADRRGRRRRAPPARARPARRRPAAAGLAAASTCSSRASAGTATRARRASCSIARSRTPTRRWRSCATWPPASIRRSCPSAGSTPRSSRSPRARRCRSSSTSRSATACPRRSRRRRYFVVAEALTNVAKYACATHARVAVRRVDGQRARRGPRRRRRRCRPGPRQRPARTRRPRRGPRGDARARQPAGRRDDAARPLPLPPG